MLSSITPLGERGRHMRWRVTVTAYLTGSTVGGLAAGAVLGLLGWAASAVGTPVDPVLLTVAGLVCLVGLALDVGGRLPTVRRQVSEDWLHRYRGWVYGGGFGFQLGLGVVTIVTTSAVYVALAIALLSSWAAGSPLAGVVVGGMFGLVRAVPLLTMAEVTSPDRLRAALSRMARWTPRARRLALVGQGMLAVTAIVVAGGAG